MISRGRGMAICATAAVVLAGCATTAREPLAAIQHLLYVPVEGARNPRQSAPEVGVRGWVVSHASGRSFSLTLANHTASLVPMSAAADEYTANTTDGRIVALETDDSLGYPSALPPGAERSVALLLPTDVLAQQVSRVIAKLDRGRVVVALRALEPPALPAWPAAAPAGIVVSEQPRPLRIDPAPQPARPVPQILEPVGPILPQSEAPAGTVPVHIAFQQQLGSTLHAEVSWNGAPEHVTLATGEEQLFYVVPGQHELRVISRLPFIAETSARVPLVVSATEPMRVELGAAAKMTGVELRVRVVSGDRTLVDRIFAPTLQLGRL